MVGQPMKRVGYQTVYLWTCPDCGAVWQLRRRPRAGRDVACAPSGVQRLTSLVPEVEPSACGAVNISSGEREGIAPNL